LRKPAKLATGFGFAVKNLANAFDIRRLWLIILDMAAYLSLSHRMDAESTSPSPVKIREPWSPLLIREAGAAT
jgi:hypothetical protein